MGTRNLTMVISGGHLKVAQYCQWDGYPEGQGAIALAFLKTCDLNKFRKQVTKLKWITDKEEASLGEDWEKEFGYLSRDVGAEILSVIHNKMWAQKKWTKTGDKTVVHTYDNIRLQDQSSFLSDGLFCEWAYLIDLDGNTFGAYSGWGTDPLTEEDRFYDFQDSTKEYSPPKLIKNYPLDNLPSEQVFIEEINGLLQKKEVAEESYPEELQ